MCDVCKRFLPWCFSQLQGLLAEYLDAACSLLFELVVLCQEESAAVNPDPSHSQAQTSPRTPHNAGRVTPTQRQLVLCYGTIGSALPISMKCFSDLANRVGFGVYPATQKDIGVVNGSIV